MTRYSSRKVQTAMVCLFAILVVLSFTQVGTFTRASTLKYTAHEHKDRLGAVSSLSSICSGIGVDLLRAGGNAADAVGLSFEKFLVAYTFRPTNITCPVDGRHRILFGSGG